MHVFLYDSINHFVAELMRSLLGNRAVIYSAPVYAAPAPMCVLRILMYTSLERDFGSVFKELLPMRDWNNRRTIVGDSDNNSKKRSKIHAVNS